MTPWPKNPIIYEINTWVWLHELNQCYQRSTTLAIVPPEEWDKIAGLGVDAVWLMGVWERSPVGTQIARQHEDLQTEYQRVLADFSPEDVVGSPYCVHRYVVDEHLGGPEGLAVAREALAERNILLVLDFVPNHAALDHPWVVEHPEYFIQGDSDDLAERPGEFFEAGEKVFAHGRDPYFPPWTDTVQLSAFSPGLRQAAIDTLGSISDQCDGVRCDMAMLLINRVFEQTWGHLAGERAASEFWWQVIEAVREKHRGFLFMAEAYWDMEWELQQQGFDYCYDKRLYDRLMHETAEAIRQHLRADPNYQEKLVRFIENHDEPRAASIFSPQRSRAAAVTIATLPGAKLFHQGQFEGRQVKLPVQLGRRPFEQVAQNLQTFYRTLLEAIKAPVFRDGEWRLCELSGWPDNASYTELVAWCWRLGDERRLIVVNFSDFRAQARIRPPWDDLVERAYRLTDVFTGDVYARTGAEMSNPGLYVELDAWDFHFLRIEEADQV
ncbi:MAG: alpha-amylase [Deltaproteobacteria bacterium]|nr:alpha-amylase [Deltaproteobacteria bacterium]